MLLPRIIAYLFATMITGWTISAALRFVADIKLSTLDAFRVGGYASLPYAIAAFITLQLPPQLQQTLGVGLTFLAMGLALTMIRYQYQLTFGETVRFAFAYLAFLFLIVFGFIVLGFLIMTGVGGW